MKRYIAVLEIEDDVEIVGDIEAVVNYTYRDNGTNYAYTESVEFKLEQEPKTGHWTEKEHNFEKCWAECSVCGKTARGYSKDTGWGFEYSYTDYCPNCGARMESEAAE